MDELTDNEEVCAICFNTGKYFDGYKFLICDHTLKKDLGLLTDEQYPFEDPIDEEDDENNN